MAARSTADLDRIRRCQQILADHSLMAAESSDVPALRQLTAMQAARWIGIKHSRILQYRRRTGDLLIVSGRGCGAGVVGEATFWTDLGSGPGDPFRPGSRSPASR